MRIDWLRITNFRSFEEREFRFAPQFNVLIGDNATGKTAVLEAAAVAAGSWMLGIKGAPSKQILRTDARLEDRLENGQVTFHEQFPVEVTAVGQVMDEALTWSRTRNGPTGNTTWKGSEQVKNLAASADSLVRSRHHEAASPLPAILYYRSDRLWDEPYPDWNPKLTQRELSRLSVYEAGIEGRFTARELRSWLEFQDRIAYQHGFEALTYQVVKEAMRRLAEGATEIRFDRARLEVVVQWDDGRLIPFSRLSDGQRNMLALAGHLAMCMSRLNPQLGAHVLDQTPGVVMIDEIDLHLHPTWQQHVVEDLRRTFPLVQFIATTHSPFIVQTLRESELISLDQQTVPEVANLSVETIAHDLMGVDSTDASPRYHEMVNAARAYFRTLDEAANVPPEALADYRDRLARIIEPYADNPAYQAFLEMNRTARLRE